MHIHKWSLSSHFQCSVCACIIFLYFRTSILESLAIYRFRIHFLSPSGFHQMRVQSTLYQMVPCSLKDIHFQVLRCLHCTEEIRFIWNSFMLIRTNCLLVYHRISVSIRYVCHFIMIRFCCPSRKCIQRFKYVYRSYWWFMKLSSVQQNSVLVSVGINW